MRRCWASSIGNVCPGTWKQKSTSAVVPPNAVVARLEDEDIRTRLKAKQQELAVAEADVRAQEERIRLTESTWTRDVSARRADVAHDLRRHDGAAGNGGGPSGSGRAERGDGRRVGEICFVQRGQVGVDAGVCD